MYVVRVGHYSCYHSPVFLRGLPLICGALLCVGVVWCGVCMLDWLSVCPHHLYIVHVQVLEMYTSGGGLNLELPNGKHKPAGRFWVSTHQNDGNRSQRLT